MLGIYEILDKWEILVQFRRHYGWGELYELRGDRRVGICINPDIDLKRRVQTFIHELLHIKYKTGWKTLDKFNAKKHEYYRRLKVDLGNDFILGGVLENIIDEEAEEIYDCQPRLVKYLTFKYKLDREPSKANLQNLVLQPSKTNV